MLKLLDIYSYDIREYKRNKMKLYMFGSVLL